MTIKANNVVNEVMTVLESVSFIDLLYITLFENDLYLLKFSLTLSNTTTVSFIEYPAVVNNAATIARLNSKFKIEKSPMVENTS